MTLFCTDWGIARAAVDARFALGAGGCPAPGGCRERRRGVPLAYTKRNHRPNKAAVATGPSARFSFAKAALAHTASPGRALLSGGVLSAQTSGRGGASRADLSPAAHSPSVASCTRSQPVRKPVCDVRPLNLSGMVPDRRDQSGTTPLGPSGLVVSIDRLPPAQSWGAFLGGATQALSGAQRDEAARVVWNPLGWRAASWEMVDWKGRIMHVEAIMKQRAAA